MLPHSASSALGLSCAPLLRRSASVLGLFGYRPLRYSAYRCVIMCWCQCFSLRGCSHVYALAIVHLPILPSLTILPRVMTAPSLGDYGGRPLQSSAYRRPIRCSATLEFGCSGVSSSFALAHFLFPSSFFSPRCFAQLGLNT